MNAELPLNICGEMEDVDPLTLSVMENNDGTSLYVKPSMEIKVEEEAYAPFIKEYIKTEVGISDSPLEVYIKTEDGENDSSVDVKIEEEVFVNECEGEIFVNDMDENISDRIDSALIEKGSCGVSGAQKSPSITPSTTQSAEKPFRCAVCVRDFAQQYDLISHLYIHTGERPFPCKICKKAFHQKSYLVSHMKMHSGTKPYSCSKCGKSFSLRGNLINHGKVHGTEKPSVTTERSEQLCRENYIIENPVRCIDCGEAYSETLITHKRVCRGASRLNGNSRLASFRYIRHRQNE